MDIQILEEIEVYVNCVDMENNTPLLLALKSCFCQGQVEDKFPELQEIISDLSSFSADFDR